MDVYTGLMEAMNSEYELVRRLREGERVSVSVVRHARSGRRYILRLLPGCGDGCRRLLSLSCPHLPLIYEVCEHGGSTAVLEEFFDYATAMEGVWFATGSELHAYCEEALKQ